MSRNRNQEAGPDQAAENASPGTDPPDETQKKATPAQAACDAAARDVSPPTSEEEKEALLDDAIELTFPASDALAIIVGGTTRIEKPTER